MPTIKKYPNAFTAVQQAVSTPQCDLKISKKCAGKALKVILDDDGTPIKVCHYCNWLKTRGVEWNPQPIDSGHKVSRIPTQNDDKVAKPVPQDGNTVNPEARYDA